MKYLYEDNIIKPIIFYANLKGSFQNMLLFSLLLILKDKITSQTLSPIFKLSPWPWLSFLYASQTSLDIRFLLQENLIYRCILQKW